jgi:membrane fusion protein (multidrug efflux system)
MVVVDIDPLRLRLKVPEKVAAWIAVGQPVTATVEAHPDRSFAGTVSRMSPAVDRETRTLEVEALLDNRESLLKPGFFAKARIASSQVTEVLVVPADAVRYVFGVYKVYAVESGTLHEREVKLGERTGDEVEIVEGLTEKQQVALPLKGEEPREGAPVTAVEAP